MRQLSTAKKLITQLSKFSVIGAINTIYGILAHYILLEIMQLPLYPVHVAVYMSGIVISYFANSKFTFKVERGLSDGIKYFSSYIIGLMIGLSGLFVLDKTTDFSDFSLVLIVIPFRMFVTFVFIKKVVYSD